MTEELQFQGQSSDGSLSYQVGGYIELSRPLGWNGGLTAQFLDCSNLQALQCTNTTGLGNISASATQMKFDNKGLYAQATYKLTSQLSLTGGFRYTFDKIAGATESTRYQFGAGGRIQICNDPLNFPQPGTNPPSGLVVTNRAQCHREQTVSWKKPTWLAGVDYKPVDDLLLYAKYSRGYRQGGLNFTNIALETWRPEKVDAYEIGAKYSFNGAVRGYFNIAGFYNDFTDQQVFGGLVADARSGIAGGAGIFNAGKSRIQGVEVDASMLAFGGFRVDLGYTYLKTELLEIALPPATYPYTAYIPTGVVGDPLTLSPKHRLTVSANYTLPVDESVGRISAGATYTYTSKQVANGGSPIGVLPDTNLLNLNLNWNGITGSPFDVALFGTNVTNRKYPVNVLGAYASAGFDGYLMGAPRMYGLRIRYNFGS